MKNGALEHVKLPNDCSWMLRKIFSQRHTMMRLGFDWKKVIMGYKFSIHLPYKLLVGVIPKVP